MPRNLAAEASTSETEPVCLGSTDVRESHAASRPTLALLGAATVAATTLSACGGGGSSGSASDAAIRPMSASAAVSIGDADAARFLLHAQFSASDADISAVKAQGYTAWLASQYAAPIGTTGWDWLAAKGYTAITSDKFYNKDYMADYALWYQLIASPDQVRKRLALALSEHFVASINGSVLWPSHLAMAYWDMLNANLFGNFRTLLEQVTLSPQMGFWLNILGSVKADATTGIEPDENYAREIMQLFTIGLYQLNADGTYRTDLFGNPQETYTQDDITSLARIFTGYHTDMSTTTKNTVSWQGTAVYSADYTRLNTVVNAAKHSPEAATFLGVTVPANADAATGLKIALDTLVNHANTGPFFARQMIQLLVTSNPSPAYIGRVAAAFNDNGAGVRGDLRAVWTAIFTDAEALAQQDATVGGKLREPMVRFVQWARTTEATSSTGAWAIYNMMAADTKLGQSPMRSPTVFNFYRPGYVPPDTQIATRKLVAPEFQILNETSTAGYLNFMFAVIQTGVADLKPQNTTLLGIADAAALTDWLNLHLTANQLSANSVSLIQATLAAMDISTDANKLMRVQAGLFLVLACPEYLIQK